MLFDWNAYTNANCIRLKMCFYSMLLKQRRSDNAENICGCFSLIETIRLTSDATNKQSKKCSTYAFYVLAFCFQHGFVLFYFFSPHLGQRRANTPALWHVWIWEQSRQPLHRHDNNEKQNIQFRFGIFANQREPGHRMLEMNLLEKYT